MKCTDKVLASALPGDGGSSKTNVEASDQSSENAYKSPMAMFSRMTLEEIVEVLVSLDIDMSKLFSVWNDRVAKAVPEETRSVVDAGPAEGPTGPPPPYPQYYMEPGPGEPVRSQLGFVRHAEADSSFNSLQGVQHRQLMQQSLFDPNYGNGPIGMSLAQPREPIAPVRHYNSAPIDAMQVTSMPHNPPLLSQSSYVRSPGPARIAGETNVMDFVNSTDINRW